VVAHRLACNRYLADAVHKRAFASLRRSAWAREVYAVASHAIGFADPRPSDHSPGVGAYEDDEENWSGLTHVDNGIC
jgi:hypothetical protein